MTRHSDAAETLLVPKGSQPSTGRTTHRELPSDLQQQSARRLRALALLYAFVFFMAGFVPALLFEQERAMLFSHLVHWLPGALAIAVAFAAAAVVSRTELSAVRLAMLAAVFEVVSSYGIAAAEFFQPEGLMINGNFMGLSWVAVWIPIFTIVVPTSPRRALMSAVAAMTSVPVMVAVSIRLFPTDRPITAGNFFFGFVFPYALVVVMAYVGGRVIYALGTEVRRARELGSYRLVERLGAGGMGEVWRAKHRLLARPAAIKLIRPPAGGPSATGGSDDTAGQVSDTARRRFEREAQVTANLRSPHTVNLFDFGMADDGSFYYVMELLEGLDCERLVKRFGPQPAERVIHILRQMCHSLSEAESIGLVHRDIKPGNIFLCHYGEDYDFVKVLDFGIAKAVNEPNSEPAMTVLTVQHIVQGTPAFIAPEQAMGANIDSRADIYAAACVAYWLLTGHLVFEADTPMQLMMHHAQTEPAPPSTRTEVVIPPMLDQVILECLAKNPADRPQTARELVQRLSQVPCPDPWTEDRARVWWKIHQPQA